MAALQIPGYFEQSYENFQSYPCSLIHKTSYPGALKGYKQRLDDSASKLCTKNEMMVEVPFRDFEVAGSTGAEQGNHHPILSRYINAEVTSGPETKHF